MQVLEPMLTLSLHLLLPLASGLLAGATAGQSLDSPIETRIALAPPGSSLMSPSSGLCRASTVLAPALQWCVAPVITGWETRVLTTAPPLGLEACNCDWNTSPGCCLQGQFIGRC